MSFAPSSTAKAFASVLNKSDSNAFGPQAPSTSSSSSNRPPTADEDDPVLFQYYINLRGLNHSLLSTISKCVEDDPFADMSRILEAYKSTYLKIQKEKDDAAAASKQESSFTTPKSSPSDFFSMPAAPSPFGTPLAAAQSSVPASDVVSTPATSFLSQSTAGVQPFGFSPSTGSKTLNETSTQSLFGAPSQKPSFFSPSEQTSSATTTSTFGSTSSPFKFGSSTSSTTNQFSPSTFGSTTPSSTFKWGATAEPSTSTITSTLTPATNNAVHFQFGGGPSGIPQLQAKTAISVDEKTADDAVDGEASQQVTSATEGGGESSGTSTLLATHHPHDDEGEGEENEISVHAIKVKAYRMKKTEPGWADLGFGERFCRSCRNKLKS